MYAIIETGGKQYKVEKGMKLDVELLEGNPGDTLVLSKVLAIGDTGMTKIGTPVVEGATVTVKVVAHVKGEKLIVFKMKRRKKYRKKTGHRQPATRIEVTGISE